MALERPMQSIGVLFNVKSAEAVLCSNTNINISFKVNLNRFEFEIILNSQLFEMGLPKFSNYE